MWTEKRTSHDSLVAVGALCSSKMCTEKNWLLVDMQIYLYIICTEIRYPEKEESFSYLPTLTFCSTEGLGFFFSFIKLWEKYLHKAIMILIIYSLNILKICYNLDNQIYTNTYNSSLDKRQNWTSISTCVSETEENVSSITDENTIRHAVFAQRFYRNIFRYFVSIMDYSWVSKHCM